MSIPSLASYEMPQTPIANRVAWRPDPARAALLIHDMQDYFLGKYDVAQAPIPQLIKTIQHLRGLCHERHIPVFYTAQPAHQPPADRALLNDFWGPGITAADEQPKAAIAAALQPLAGDTVLPKWRYSAFQRSDLRPRLRALGRDQLIITGIYAHIGCLATALEAFMQDVEPFLVINGCADFSLADHQMAIAHVARCCGVSLTARQIESALDPRALPPETLNPQRPAR